MCIQFKNMHIMDLGGGVDGGDCVHKGKHPALMDLQI